MRLYVLCYFAFVSNIYNVTKLQVLFVGEQVWVAFGDSRLEVMSIDSTPPRSLFQLKSKYGILLNREANEE